MRAVASLLDIQGTVPAMAVKRHNGAANKPRRARKPQIFSPEVGLIRVVVRREASATTDDYVVSAHLPQSDMVDRNYLILLAFAAV